MSLNDSISPPVALTIAGSDCSGGAGAQADLKVFQHFGVFGMSAITCVVAETPREVGSVHPVLPEIVGEQVTMLLSAYPVAAIKTGMLFSRAHIEAVAEALGGHPAPLVVDPVMMASTGDALIEDDAVDAYRSLLFPRAAVITPNLDEAVRLTGLRIETPGEMERAAAALFEEYRTPVILKGGHLGSGEVRDLLREETGSFWVSGERVETEASHGTGCTFAAVVAACLARNMPMVEAFKTAKRFVHRALEHGFSWSGPDGRTIHALDQGTNFEFEV